MVRVKVKAAVSGWSSGSFMCSTPMPFPKVLNAKQGNNLYDSSGHWCDSMGVLKQARFTAKNNQNKPISRPTLIKTKKNLAVLGHFLISAGS